jgi:ribosomal protein S6
VLTFESEPEALQEVTRVLAITDGVMRHMAVARPHGTAASPAPPSQEPAESPA